MVFLETDKIACYAFPKNGLDRSTDWVSVVGTQSIAAGETYPSEGFPQKALFDDAGGRCIDQFQLVYISQGNGIFIDRGLEYTIPEGSVFLLRPGFWHSYSPDPTTGWTEYFIGFNGETLSRIVMGGISQEGSVYMLPIIHRDAFLTMLKYARDENEDTPLLLLSMLFMILSGIVYGQAASPNGGKKSAKLMVKVRNYMEKNIEKPFSLQELAAEMGVSYTAFNTLFKQQSGLSPVHYLGKLRLQRAKYKLLKTDLPIKIISKDCGFSSVEYFCNFFRKETGASPSQFREQNKNNNL
ncbi:MAG: AraC family transcriptional regulator [Bacteroidales bacterium]|nr:AraC family transcriptional regulator [Bacteroidales bacterium]